MKLIPRVKVKPLYYRNGSIAKGQYVVTLNDCKVLQSYGSVVAIVFNDGTIYLDTEKLNYSKTTSYYRNKFLDMSQAEVEQKIKDRQIKLMELNDD